MPNLASIVSRFTDQTILYWEKETLPDGFSKPAFKTPVSLLVRWEDKLQEIVLPDGRKILSRGYILCSTIMVPGSLVWRGTTLGKQDRIADWTTQEFYPTIPTVNQGAREVLIVNSTPGMRQLPGNVYEIYL